MANFQQEQQTNAEGGGNERVKRNESNIPNGNFTNIRLGVFNFLTARRIAAATGLGLCTVWVWVVTDVVSCIHTT